MTLRTCFLLPPPEAHEAARFLQQAYIAHQQGDKLSAAFLIKQANMPAIRAWTESLWGKASPHVMARVIPLAAPITKIKVRMPNSVEKAELHKRDVIIVGFVAYLSSVRKFVKRYHYYTQTL